MARFLHLSDLHVVKPGTLCSGVLDTPRLLKEAIDTIISRRDAFGQLDGMVITGDISDDGSEESYQQARMELDRLELPLLAIPGNHDNREEFRKAFADQPSMPESGLIDWVVDISETRLIGLDTLIEGQGGGTLRPQSLDHLANALNSADGREVVVAMHHPPLKTGIRFMDNIGLDNIEVLADLLQRAQLKGHVLSGHVHGVYMRSLARMMVTTAPSICSAFMLDRRQDASIGFMTIPTGFALLETGREELWSVLPLGHGNGPFPF